MMLFEKLFGRGFDSRQLH